MDLNCYTHTRTLHGKSQGEPRSEAGPFLGALEHRSRNYAAPRSQIRGKNPAKRRSRARDTVRDGVMRHGHRGMHRSKGGTKSGYGRTIKDEEMIKNVPQGIITKTAYYQRRGQKYTCRRKVKPHRKVPNARQLNGTPL